MLYVTFENKLFLESYILHAKYRIFHKKYMINTHLISRPEKVRIFMINKTHNWSVLVKLKLMVIIRIVYLRNKDKISHYYHQICSLPVQLLLFALSTQRTIQ